MHVVIHSLDHAMVAAGVADASPLVLWSAAGGANTVGAGWFAAVGRRVAERHPALSLTLVLDCADEAGAALGALRAGLRYLRFTGDEKAADKLRAMGAVLVEPPEDEQPLDLAMVKEHADACRLWLARRKPAR